jgi:tripartite-type tricarboxylate transporter receptor subunit TctC
MRCREFIGALGGTAAAWRPVRIVVGFAAGQAIDIIVRLIGQWLSERDWSGYETV